MKKIKKSNVVFGVIVLITSLVLIIFSYKTHWSIAALSFLFLVGLPFIRKIKPGKRLVSLIKKITDFPFISILPIALWVVGILFISKILFTLTFSIINLLIVLVIGLLLYIYLPLVLIPTLFILTSNDNPYEND